MENGREVSKKRHKVNGWKHGVYAGKNVSMAHQSQIHAPAVVGNVQLADNFNGKLPRGLAGSGSP